MAQSLFSDGAGAFVVATKGPWKFKDAGMSMIPDSTDLLGMVPHSKPGEPQRQSYKMMLSPKVSDALGSYFSDGPGYELLRKILAKNCDNTLPALAVHPGGPRILDAMLVPLTEKFGIDGGALQPSFDTLFKYGNLGCTAILFVLASVFAATADERVVSMAFGPGVTVEWGAFERV